MKIKLFLIVLSSMVINSLMSCKSSDTDKSDTKVMIDTHNSVSMEIKINHVGNIDLMYTSKTVYDASGKVVKTLTTCDTLPQLGNVKDTLDTGKTYTDADGDEQEKDTVVTHLKDYQLFISVKK